MALSVDFFDDRDEAALLAHARSGDAHSADVLWVRLRPAALAVARRIAENHHDAEDLASEAMTKVFTAIAAGNGPADALFPYLCATMRNLHVSNLRRRARAGTSLELEDDRVLNLVSPAADTIESDLVTRAFKELPERWRFVLWASLIEGRPGHEVAADLKIKPGAVHALKSRALEGLRQQYLAAHARLCDEQECAEVHRVLAAIARGKAKRSTDLGQVWKHLRTCEHCAEGYREITAINNRIGLLLGPAAIAAGILVPTSGIGGSAGLLRLPSEAGKAAVAAGIAGAIALGGTALTLDRGPSSPATTSQASSSVAAPVAVAGPAAVRLEKGSVPKAPAARAQQPCLGVDLGEPTQIRAADLLIERLTRIIPDELPSNGVGAPCVAEAPAPPALVDPRATRRLVPDLGEVGQQIAPLVEPLRDAVPLVASPSGTGTQSSSEVGQELLTDVLD